MSQKRKILMFLIFISVFVLFFLYFNNIKNYTQIENTETIKLAQEKQLILIIIDGMQVSRYNELLADGSLPNLKKIIINGGENSFAVITGHTETSTAPGNAEIHTGLNSTLNNISDNSCGKVITPGTTIFERLANFNSDIILGSIYGKETCYIPLSLLSNAQPIISWWQDSKTYSHENYTTDSCTDSTDVASKSLEFLQKYKDKSFYLFIYLGAPDCTGHAFGTNTLEYDKSIINVDDGIGVLLDGINSYNLKPEIIISGDHGFNSSSKNHNIRDDNTIVVGLITNNNLLINNKLEKKQCDIAPTVLNYFGMNSSQYPDITQLGCESLIKIKK